MTVRAAIDVGSNSVKLLVLDVDDTGSYRVLHDQARVTGLGRGLGDSGELDQNAVQSTLACLRDFNAIARALGAGEICAAGTSALRRASDAGRFINRVQDELGIRTEVISGEHEASLSRVVALRELPPGKPDVVFFDVGGGSTELSWCRDGEVRAEASLQLGARRCTEQAGIVHPVTPFMRERLAAMIDTALADAPRPADGAEVQLAGLGGTATSVVWMLRGSVGELPGDPHMAQVSLAQIRGMLSTLSERTAREVRAQPGLDPERADVIFAGMTIIAGLVASYSAENFTLVDRGLRFGLLLN